MIRQQIEKDQTVDWKKMCLFDWKEENDQTVDFKSLILALQIEKIFSQKFPSM